MSNEVQNKMLPKLRFKEFEDDDWNISLLGTTLKSESSTLAQNKIQFKKNGFPVYGADGLLGYVDFFIQYEDYIAIIKDGSGVGKLFLYQKQSSILGTLSYLKSQEDSKYKLIFLFYLLQTINLSSYIKGSGIPHIYYSDYSKEVVALPSFEEQQKIADCLSSLDELVTTESQQLDALKAHKKGLMQQLFPAEGETVPKLRFKEFKDGGEWEEKLLGDVCRMQAGKFVSASDINEKKEDNMYPCYGGNGLRGYTKSFTHEGNYSLIGRQGALCGNVTLVSGRFYATEHAVVVTPNKKVDTVLLYYMLVRLNLNQYATGQAQPGLSVDNLEKVSVKISKLETEQQKIANCLSSLDDLITAQSEKIATLKQHKKGLMQGLFPHTNEVTK